MSKIHYNELGIKNLVNENLNNAIKNLDQVKNICLNLSIPTGFSKKGYLVDFSSEIITHLNKVTEIKNILSASERAYSTSKNIIDGKITELDTYQIGLRESDIR